jgi:hypothetical protein
MPDSGTEPLGSQQPCRKSENMKDYARKALYQIEGSAKKNIWDAHDGCSAIALALLVSQNTFAQFGRPAPAEIGDMQLGHLLTHGHAIEILRAFGTKALMSDLDMAYRKRVRGLRAADLEQRDRTPLPRRAIDPRTRIYWELENRLGTMHGHVAKYAYSLLDLKRDLIANADLELFGRIVWPDQCTRRPPSPELEPVKKGVN